MKNKKQTLASLADIFGGKFCGARYTHEEVESLLYDYREEIKQLKADLKILKVLGVIKRKKAKRVNARPSPKLT